MTTKFSKSANNLESILPHRGDIILIDEVLDYDMKLGTLSSLVKIEEDSIFFDSDSKQVPIWVGIEYMAQTIGAFSGIYSQDKGDKIELGFVIGSRNFQSFSTGFKKGTSYIIQVNQLFFDDNLGSFECEIFDSEDVIAKAVLNVFKPDSIESFLKEYN